MTALALLLTLVPAFAATPAFADTTPQAPIPPPLIRSNSIDWQRVALEERIQAKIRSALALSIPEDKFIVTVLISLKPRPADIDPKSGQPKPEKPGIPKRERAPLGKLDLDAPLWVLEDESGNETPLSVTQPERNLFEEIQDVKISVYLDQSIPEARIPLIKQITSSLTATTGPTPPTIDVQRTDLAKKDATPLLGAPTSKADLKEFAKDFQTPIALIAVALIICGFFTGFGIIVFLGYRKLAARRLAILESKDAREDAIQRQQQEALLRQQLSAGGPASSGPSDKELELEEPPEKGFDRLRLLVREAPDRVASLIKQWTRNPMGGARDALATIPQILKTEELLVVFKYLNVEDRREWRKYLNLDVSSGLRRKVDVFLTSQIIENLLVPAPQVDSEFRELFDQIKVAEAVEISNEDPEIGAVLISLLPSAQASRIFSLLSAERATEITVICLKLTDTEIQRRVHRLKQVLKGLRERHGALPFSSRATELLKEAGPDQEAAIFNALSESGDYPTLESAARQFFPAELISRLPVKILRDCMEALSIEKRAELILSRSDEEKTWLLMALGKPGTKAREFIDLELRQLELDQTRVRRAERNRDLLWKQFTETCRAMIRNNPQTAEMAETLLSDWIALKTNGATGAMGGAIAV